MKVSLNQVLFAAALAGIFLIGFQFVSPTITGHAIISGPDVPERSSLLQIGMLILSAVAIGQVIDRI